MEFLINDVTFSHLLAQGKELNYERVEISGKLDKLNNSFSYENTNVMYLYFRSGYLCFRSSSSLSKH